MGTGNSVKLLVHIEISVVQFCTSDSHDHPLTLLIGNEISEKLLVQNKISVAVSLVGVETFVKSLEGTETSVMSLEGTGIFAKLLL